MVGQGKHVACRPGTAAIKPCCCCLPSTKGPGVGVVSPCPMSLPPIPGTWVGSSLLAPSCTSCAKLPWAPTTALHIPHGETSTCHTWCALFARPGCIWMAVGTQTHAAGACGSHVGVSCGHVVSCGGLSCACAYAYVCTVFKQPTKVGWPTLLDSSCKKRGKVDRGPQHVLATPML